MTIILMKSVRNILIRDCYTYNAFVLLPVYCFCSDPGAFPSIKPQRLYEIIQMAPFCILQGRARGTSRAHD
jgi:hypothetical protein